MIAEAEEVDAPSFDPTKPFEIVSETPSFDASKPFEVVDTQKFDPSKDFHVIEPSPSTTEGQPVFQVGQPTTIPITAGGRGVDVPEFDPNQPFNVNTPPRTFWSPRQRPPDFTYLGPEGEMERRRQRAAEDGVTFLENTDQRPLITFDRPTSMEAETAGELLTDLVPVPMSKEFISGVGKATAGVVSGLEGVIEAISTPEVLGAMASGRIHPALGKAVAAAFAGEVARSLPQQARTAATAFAEGDIRKGFEASTGAVVGAVTLPLLAQSALSDAAKAAKISNAPLTAEALKKEIPLGVFREPIRDASLERISEPELDAKRREATALVDTLEAQKDQGAYDRDALAKAQDAYTSLELENYRRNRAGIHPADLLRELRKQVDLGGVDPKSESGVKARMIMEELNRQNAAPEQMLEGLSGLTADQAEVLKGQFEKIKSIEPTPSIQALGISPPSPMFDWLNKYFSSGSIKGGVDAITADIKGRVGELAGKTMAKVTLADQTAGELGARWISSRIAAKPLADLYADSVLDGLAVDPKKFGAALTEDNLRSVREGFVAEGDVESAAKVNTMVGEEKPFKTEEEYQSYLAQPDVQTAINRHRALWESKIEPMYKEAMQIDPGEELPSRGLQTEARINLMADRGEPKGPITAAIGNLANTLRRKSPFGTKATGTAEGYVTDYTEIMRNTYGNQLEIANKNAFEKRLVESKNAVIDRPGETIMIGGEEAVPFPLVRRTIVTEDGAVPQNKMLYVRKSLAPEYRIAANVEGNPFEGKVSHTLGNIINRIQMASFTDATVHVSNLATALFTRPGGMPSALSDSLISLTGRADIPIAITKALYKSFQDRQGRFARGEVNDQLAQLAEIGAMREQSHTGILSKFIGSVDQMVRLSLDDMFTNLVKEGLVKDTETNRREFVNQVGQYNRRAQPAMTRFFRDSGIGPFITAGKTFTTLGARNVALHPGAEATSVQARVGMAVNIAAKLAGTMVLIGTINYLLSGKVGGGVAGRPGTPIGKIDTGADDETGRPLQLNALDLIGFGRGLRVSGLRGFMDAKLLGLPDSTARDAAYRDIANTIISPIAGPVVRSGMSALSGYEPAIKVGRKFPVVPPGESQMESDMRHAAIDLNPFVGALVASQEPGATPTTLLERQFPRYIPQPGKPESMIEHYPEIVRKAQASEFTDNVIGRARKMGRDDSNKVISQAFWSLDDKDKAMFLRKLKERRLPFTILPK